VVLDFTVRGTSLIRNCGRLGPYSRTIYDPMAVLGGWIVSYDRGTTAPEASLHCTSSSRHRDATGVFHPRRNNCAFPLKRKRGTVPKSMIRFLPRKHAKSHAPPCEDRTQDGPASGEKGSNVGPLARLYSG